MRERSDVGTRYSIVEHRHRFAVWAAARAASRGLSGGTTKALARVIETCGVADVVAGPSRAWPSSASAYDAIHRGWCAKAIGKKNAGVTFGRAAKLIAIYLKATVVMARHHENPFGRVLHPPVDARLLSALAKNAAYGAAARKVWRSARWTTFDAKTYATVIASFRDEGLDQLAFWRIESGWTVT